MGSNEITRLTTPDGKIEEWTNVGKMCSTHGLNAGSIYNKFNIIGKKITHKGFEIEKKKLNPGYQE